MYQNSAFQGVKRAIAFALLLAISSTSLFAQAAAPVAGLSSVEREIARGGAARVYRAEDKSGRAVAPSAWS